MRLQIAELPAITLGEHTERPFILILDTLTEEQQDMLSDENAAHHLRQSTGARAVLAFSEPIDIPAALDLDEEAKARLQAALRLALNR